MTNEQKNVNREYKDRLFKLVFGEKKDLLELYNAINDTTYQNPDDIEINTLKDVVYMGMKNDVSFLLTDVLNLYEHQSTLSPNLPLRGLFYFADLYRKLFGQNKDLYSSKLISLPLPQFIVFYNGNEEEPEQIQLSLKDAFQSGKTRYTPCLDCTAILLNINAGHNAQLMNRCKRLWEYSEFVACVKQKLRENLAMEQAIDEAVEECIQRDILKEILTTHRAEVKDMLLTEYNEELHIKSEKALAEAEGEARGKKIGEARFSKLIQILLELNDHDTIAKIATDEAYREKLYEKYQI